MRVRLEPLILGGGHRLLLLDDEKPDVIENLFNVFRITLRLRNQLSANGRPKTTRFRKQSRAAGLGTFTNAPGMCRNGWLHVSLEWLRRVAMRALETMT